MFFRICRILLILLFLCLCISITSGANMPSELIKKNIQTPSQVEYPVNQKEQNVSDNEALITKANNQFATNLLHAFSADNEYSNKNLFYSPYSIFSALSLIREGSRNKTAEEMSSVLSLPEGNLVIRDGFLSLMNGLEANSNGLTLDNANALWIENEYPLLLEYTNMAEKYYEAKISNLDFNNSPKESMEIINGWVKEKTHNKIKEIIQPDMLSPQTKFLLTNAIYFNGSWETQFNNQETSDEIFNSNPETKIPIKMMTKTGVQSRFNYYEDDNLQVIELPYAKDSGKNLSMIILLPKSFDLLTAQAALDSQNFSAIRKNLQKTAVDIYIPKFTLSENYDLNSILSSLGMSSAFSYSADFSGMDGTNLLNINKVIHKSYVDVNEHGTEASALTAIIIVGSMDENRPTFKADHPFIFIIQDKDSGAILFIGRIMNPEEK